MRNISLCLIVFFLLSFFAGCKNKKEQEEDERYKVVEAVLRHKNLSYLKKYSRVVIVSDSADLSKELLVSKGHLGEKLKETIKFIQKKRNVKVIIPERLIERFVEVNKKSIIFDKPINFKNVEMLSVELKNNIFEEGGYDSFYKRYPNSGGYHVFSNVGFSKNMNEALIYHSSFANPTGAGGNIIYLKKEAGVWSAKDFIMLWVS